MSLPHGHIAAQVFNTPLLYDPRKAEAFLLGLGGRIAGGSVVITNPEGVVEHTGGADGRPLAGKIGNRIERAYARSNMLPFDMVDNVAIIPIEGSLVHKGSWVGQSSGATSYQGVQAQVAMARRSPSVRGVVYEVDSYGGHVNGGFETAAAMAQLSREKPTMTILTDHAYSAGYLLGAQGRQIVAPRFGGAGSIGVIMIHADYTGWLEKQGVALTIITAGKKKAEGNPYEHLSPEVAARWQAQAEGMRDVFAETVAKARRGRLTKAKALSTEAEAFDAADALSLGLIDAIGDPLEAFEAFVKEVNRS